MTMRTSLISASAVLVATVAPTTGTDPVVAGPRPDDAAVAVFDWDPGTPTGFLGVESEHVHRSDATEPGRGPLGRGPLGRYRVDAGRWPSPR